MSSNKYHIGNGTVYLEGWINVDIASDHCFLAEERPDLVEKYSTGVNNYYGRHTDQDFSRFRAGHQERETVTDRYGSFLAIPARSGEAENILAVQTFEHFSIGEAQKILQECWRVLDYGGILTLDVPDTEESIRLFGETGDEFYIRHIVGPKARGSWGFHCMAYSKEELVNLVTSFGFRMTQEERNIHSYPAICLSFEKITKP